MSDLFGLTQAAVGGYPPTRDANSSAWPARKVLRYGGAARHGHSPADPLGRPPCDRASMEVSAAWIASQLEMTRIAKNTTDMRGPPGLRLVPDENKAGGGRTQFNTRMWKS